jgi:hypothetical protein
MAIALIVGGIKGGGANGATTDAANTSGANLIVLCAHEYQIGTTTISDSASNTWTALTAQGSGNQSRLYYCLNPTTSGTHTFTLSRTGSYSCLGYIAVSGVASYHSENIASQGAAATFQPGSVTPGADGSLIVAGITTSGTSAHTIDGGYTAYQLPFSSGNYMGCGIAYLIQTTAAATNPTWTFGYSPAAGPIAVFSPSTGGIVGPLLRGRLTGGGILRGRLIRG